MVDEIHRIDRNNDGTIRRIEYSGWEANGDGAHYRRRTWGLGRFASIHVLELQAPAADSEQSFIAGGRPARPSLQDAPRYAARQEAHVAQGQNTLEGTQAEANGSDLRNGTRGR